MSVMRNRCGLMWNHARLRWELRGNREVRLRDVVLGVIAQFCRAQIVARGLPLHMRSGSSERAIRDIGAVGEDDCDREIDESKAVVCDLGVRNVGLDERGHRDPSHQARQRDEQIEECVPKEEGPVDASLG